MWAYRVIDATTQATLLTIEPGGGTYQPRADPPAGLAGVEREVRVAQARGDGIVAEFNRKPRVVDLAIVVSVQDALEFANTRQQLRDALARGEPVNALEIEVSPTLKFRTHPFICTSVYETPTGPYACEMTFRLLFATPDLMIYEPPQTLSLAETTATADRHLLWDMQTGGHYVPSSLQIGLPVWVMQHGDVMWVLYRSGVAARWTLPDLFPLGGTVVGSGLWWQLLDFAGQLIARGGNGLRRWDGAAWQPFGPAFPGGTVRGAYVAGDRLLAVGAFTGPRKYYCELDSSGAVVSSDIFGGAASGELRSAWGGEGMRLYAGMIDGNTGVWCEAADNPPIQVAESDSIAMSLAGKSFARVYMSTQGNLVNGAPSGRLVSIRYGQSIAPVGEGLVRVPRMLVESAGDIYIPCFADAGVGALYRIHRGGLQVLATANDHVQCVAHMPAHKRLAIVGNFSQCSRLHSIACNTAFAHAGWAVGTTAHMLSCWREYDDDCWSADLSQPAPSRTYITPSRSTNHGSGTDWRTHRKYAPDMARMYMTFHHGSAGQLQNVFLRDGI